MRARNLFLLLVAAIFIALPQCTDQVPTFVNDDKSLEVRQAFDSVGSFPDPPPPYEDTVKDTTYCGDPACLKPPYKEVWECRETHVTIADDPIEYSGFGQNAEFLRIGEVLDGRTIHLPTPDIVPARRGPGKIAIDNITGAEKPTAEVAVADHTSVTAAVNEIIATHDRWQFAITTGISVKQFSSYEELQTILRVKSSFLMFFSQKADFSYDESGKMNHFIVRITQKYYTLIFQPPDSPEQFFAGDVTAAELWPYMEAGYPLCWISSITYGRACYLIVSSTESASTVKASVEASFVFGGFSGSTKHVSQLAGLEVRALFVGGDGKSAIQAVRGGIQNLDSFLAAFENPDIRSAAPLTYQVRELSRGYKVVANNYATSYSRRNCQLIDSPDFVSKTPFSVSGNRTVEIPIPTIDYSKRLTFLSGLSYNPNRDDDYGFEIEFGHSQGRDRYRITSSIGNSGSQVWGQIVSWVLPDYVEIDRVMLEIDGRESRKHLVPEVAGKESFTIVELMSYHTDGNDKLQWSCTLPTAGDPYVRLASNSENAGRGERIKVRVTTLRWPKGSPIEVRTRSLKIEGDGSSSLQLTSDRVITAPTTYLVNGDHDYHWTFISDHNAVSLHTGRGRAGARVIGTVYEWSFVY